MNKCLSVLIKLSNESVVYFKALSKTFRNSVKLKLKKKKVIHLYLNFKYGLVLFGNSTRS